MPGEDAFGVHCQGGPFVTLQRLFRNALQGMYIEDNRGTEWALGTAHAQMPQKAEKI